MIERTERERERAREMIGDIKLQAFEGDKWSKKQKKPALPFSRSSSHLISSLNSLIPFIYFLKSLFPLFSFSLSLSPFFFLSFIPYAALTVLCQEYQACKERRDQKDRRSWKRARAPC